LIETRVQGQSTKKYSMQQKNNPTHSNYHYSQQNQPQSYNNNNNPSSMGTNGLHPQSNPNIHMTKNGPMSFLPRITGASAFSNYTVNTGNSSSIANKVKYVFFSLLRIEFKFDLFILE
jgi:hypothetical protein